MSRYGMRLGAARFVAGETLDECVVVLRRLADQGLHANTTLLGESIRERAEAEAVADEYARILERLHAERLPCNVALKLTHLGLELDEELAYANVERVVQVAERLESFVRIDMEQSSVVDATLRIYRRLREAGHDRVGTVLQSYLVPHGGRPGGAAPARAEPALREGRVPRAAGDRLLRQGRRRRRLRPARRDGAPRRRLRGDRDARRGAHRRGASRFAEREGIGRDRFELQMLYGVRPGLQLELVAPRVQGARRDAVRARVVPVPHAAARRAAREPRLLRAEPRPALTSRLQLRPREHDAAGGTLMT